VRCFKSPDRACQRDRSFRAPAKLCNVSQTVPIAIATIKRGPGHWGGAAGIFFPVRHRVQQWQAGCNPLPESPGVVSASGRANLAAAVLDPSKGHAPSAKPKSAVSRHDVPPTNWRIGSASKNSLPPNNRAGRAGRRLPISPGHLMSGKASWPVHRAASVCLDQGDLCGIRKAGTFTRGPQHICHQGAHGPGPSSARVKGFGCTLAIKAIAPDTGQQLSETSDLISGRCVNRPVRQRGHGWCNLPLRWVQQAGGHVFVDPASADLGSP